MQREGTQSRGQAAAQSPSHRAFARVSHAPGYDDASAGDSAPARDPRARNAGARREHQRADNSDGLVRRYGELVRRIAYHLARRLPPSIEVADLIQAGMIGLLEAASAFDGGHGASFATFAGLRIRGAMIDALRKLDWRPRSVSGKARAVTAAMRDVENETGRFARDAEIAQRLDMSLDDYRTLQHAVANARPASLEECDVTTVSGGRDPFSEVAEQSLGPALSAALERLPDRERQVMSLHYREGRTVGDISARLRVTESRVCQLRARAIERLREHLEDWG